MIDMVDLLGRLWKHRLKVLLLTAVFYLGCVGLYLLATPEYMSHSKWISPSQDPAASSLQKLGSLFGAGGIPSQDDFTNYSDIIISSEFLRPLLKRKVRLTGTPDSVLLEEVLWKRHYAERYKHDSLLRSGSAELENEMVERIRGWVNFVSRSPVYQLRVTAWDPALAQSFNERIIERAVEYNTTERGSLSKRKRAYLESQLESFKTALNASEDRLLAFEMKNLSVQSPALVLERSRLMREVQINGKLVAEFRTEYELARAEEDKESVQISTIEKPSFSASKTFPGKGLFLVGGAFVSLILAAALMLFYEFSLLVRQEYPMRRGKRLSVESARA